jgi:hypothetical protein
MDGLHEMNYISYWIVRERYVMRKKNWVINNLKEVVNDQES